MSGASRWWWGVVGALAGVLAAAVLGLLTFGVQTTAGPRGIPLAVSVPSGPVGTVLAPIAEQVAGQGGEQVSWRIVDPPEAARLLDETAVYGVLGLSVEGGVPAVTTTTSGAVNASGTQAAEQVLGRAGQAVAGVIGQRTGTIPSVTATVVHASTPAARSLPLSATALLWIVGLAANAVVLLGARRNGQPVGRPTLLVAALAVAVTAPAVVIGFAALWQLDLTWSGATIGFLVLVAGAFAVGQGAVLRLLGLPGLGLLGLLYLSAPAVAGQVPELLLPAYRVVLWSWSPIRFSAEAVRSLLFSDGVAPTVGAGVVVFAVIAAAALLILALPQPGRAPRPAQSTTGPAKAEGDPTPAASTPAPPEATPEVTGSSTRAGTV